MVYHLNKYWYVMRRVWEALEDLFGIVLQAILAVIKIVVLTVIIILWLGFVLTAIIAGCFAPNYGLMTAGIILLIPLIFPTLD